ncbi:hypothetical protein B9G53_15945 [Pseudanabaena sp. SR411]|uniref:NACHT domain-containing protein n=1 Tax=Pseudanabaena sp. SR411 TaxID=1980935 RepID=UPI000B9839EA|nr:NACHT domain-containing protein [Pseudanabaena sp. SR411]OYQ63600.1 hypothetical protein B9G53_15945 [Pseudanabaena sp. SR411]
MSYQKFLNDIADKYDLSGDEKEVFCVEFEDFKLNKTQTRIAQGLNISLDTLEARMTSIYKKFSTNCTELSTKSKGKLKVLGYWLQNQYEEKDRVLTLQPIDWQKETRKMLEDLKDLTTEVLTAGDGIRFDFDDVFVPLGVVERQERTKRKEDDGAPDRGSELYEEKVTPITHDEFFEDVLLRGNTRISNGKRIAVIGEAGAGKTTQLQKIGSWLLREESDDIPIWISLADLATIPLEEFIFENWVRNASGKRVAPQEWKDSLEDASASGKVWLLLDGVDEMTVSNPLSYLANQLKEGWLKNVRVVLTCRVNVWDGGKNALTDFDIYRNLDFDYPNDVYEFIDKWFAGAPELAGSLTQALEQAGKERIRDMVKNPLRLTLLCYSWQLKQGELPETKAGLYEWFVEAFYKWNKGKAQIELSRSQEDKLNRSLGELAKRAIDGETSWFRLTKNFIENVFREFDIDLFDLALKLNWLNEIGVAAEDPLETVYAFYHPSFQEYFAALAIDDQSYFLIHNPNHISQGNYRIFYGKWTEVFLFWLGRNEKHLLNQKQSLIHSLINFKDDCYGLYEEKAFVLVAKGTSEFYDFDEIVDFIQKVVNKVFSYFNESECDWIEELIPYYQLKKKSNILYQMDSYFVWLELEELHNDLMKTCQSFLDDNKLDLISYTSWSPNLKDYLKCLMVQEFMILEIAGNIDPKHPIIVERLIFQLAYDYMLIGHNVSTYDLLNLYKKNCLENPLAITALRNKISIYEEILSRHENELDLALNNEEENTNDLPKIKNQKIEAINNIKSYINELGQTLAIIDASYKHIDIQFDRTPWKHTSIFDLGFNVNIIQNQSLDSLTTQELLDLITPHKFTVDICYQLRERGMSDLEILEKLMKLLDEVWKISDIDKVDRYRILFLLEEFASDENWIELTKCFVREYLLGMLDPDFIYCKSDMKRIYEYLLATTDNINYVTFNDICQACSSNLGLLKLSSAEDISYLYSQFIDIDKVQEQIDRHADHPEIRCLVVDIRHLEQERDPNVIAKKLTNKIFNSIGRRIPVVQDVACLERELLNLKLEPEFEKLAIALYGKSANEAIAQLCQSLSPIQTCLFTGEQTTQELIIQINAWLSEM